VFIYSSCGKWTFPPLLWCFPPITTFTSFPTPDCWVCATAPAFSSRLVRDSPPSLFGRSGCPALFATRLFCCYCYYSVSLFLPELGLVCPGGYANLLQDYLWEYHLLLSSPPGPGHPKPSGHWRLVSGGSAGALLVSLFNMKWRCCVQAGGVEGSKFCFFSVVFPVMCISSVSARFYFRKHAFCFLPLAAILEFLCRLLKSFSLYLVFSDFTIIYLGVTVHSICFHGPFHWKILFHSFLVNFLPLL
jgi:hypothetical protein